MKLVPKPVSRAVGRTVLKTKANSPHIFFVGGLIGVTGSTFLACRATLKLEAVLDETRQEIDKLKSENLTSKEVVVVTESEYRHELMLIYGRAVIKIGILYGPSGALMAASIAALTGSHIQLTRRNAALSAAFTLVSKAYDDYRLKVQEELGVERENEIYRNLKEEEITVDGKKELALVGDPNKHSVYARLFDEFSPNWTKDPENNRVFVQSQQNYLNHLLNVRGHVFLNEVYDALGLERSSEGALVGWTTDGAGDGYIDFHLFAPENSRFINGLERSIFLDFNVEGIIYNKI